MKIFTCQCGQTLFFENTHCAQCGRTVGYDAQLALMVSLEPDKQLWKSATGRRYHLCQNYREYNACNWLVDASLADAFCLSCSLNETIPNLSDPDNHQWWVRMEAAKRRLVYSLLSLGLPVHLRTKNSKSGLGFAFLEDQRSNPDVGEEHVFTGHFAGLITVNLSEADELSREWQRVSLGEAYRTLLGHFRHESGHYYFDQLVAGTPQIEPFRQLFGDERLDYKKALELYHQQASSLQEDARFISKYAQSHPSEDWAESWAHYLHISEALETAVSYKIVDGAVLQLDFEQQVRRWITLSLALNGLNRGMGLNDLYPFILSAPVIEKLMFIDQVIKIARGGNTG